MKFFYGQTSMLKIKSLFKIKALQKFRKKIFYHLQTVISPERFQISIDLSIFEPEDIQV